MTKPSEPFIYENTLTLEDLRKAVRQCWDEQHELDKALLELPVVPSHEVMRMLIHAAMNSPSPLSNYWETGKKLQQEYPGLIPWKTEYECAAGLWAAMRAGILAQRAGAATRGEAKS